MFRSFLVLALASTALSGLVSTAAQAIPVQFGAALSNPTKTVDFTGLVDNQSAQSKYTLATDGITFTNLYGWSSFGSFTGSTPPVAMNATTTSSTPFTTFSMQFAASYSAAQFYLYYDGTLSGGVTITATLNGAAVTNGSFTVTSPWNSNGNDYFGFTSTNPFNKITVTTATPVLMFIDNVQLGAQAAVPEPRSAVLLLAGLVGLIVLRTRGTA